MWKIVLLFILLTPGILFTVPSFAKMRIGKMNLSSVCVHALIFVLALRWLGLGEGFQSPPMSSKMIEMNLTKLNSQLTQAIKKEQSDKSAIVGANRTLETAKLNVNKASEVVNRLNTSINQSSETINNIKANIATMNLELQNARAREAEAAAATAMKAKPTPVAKAGAAPATAPVPKSVPKPVVEMGEVSDPDNLKPVGPPPPWQALVKPSSAEVSTGGSGSIISNILSAVGIAVPGSSCPPGHSMNNGNCIKCPVGQVSPGGPGCKPCGPGSVPFNGACVRCPPGQGAFPGASSCSPCPGGGKYGGGAMGQEMGC
jgi:hypothetical protein